MNTKYIKNTLIILLICLISTITYFLLLGNLQNESGLIKLNEFGDYVGGILNPLFTLLSTIAIIFLTYIIAKNENEKADEAIDTQKRITLNEMRQEALNNLTNKLNLFAYEMDKLAIHDVKEGTFEQKLLTNMIKEENENKDIIVWLIILFEIESFVQLKYLFGNLFEDKSFLSIYESLIDITSKLSQEQNSMRMNSSTNLESYIKLRQELVGKIGSYILASF